jgi:SAM-dependent methyltransferase
MDKRIPPSKINYNLSGGELMDTASYLRAYKTMNCLKMLPYLMKVGNLRPQSAIYDHGCGLGPLAFAASNYLDESGAYFGIDINLEAVTFLKQAYADRRNFRFEHQAVSIGEDYVALENRPYSAPPPAETVLAAKDLDLVGFVDRPIDVTYSGSVFTHMWMETIVATLRQLRTLIGESGVCVSTWLIIDGFAEYVLRCGLADRELPFEINGAFTYSKSNPLVCTAYREEDVRKMYALAGREILSINWGSWSGRDNGVMYQDIVTAKAV